MYNKLQSCLKSIREKTDFKPEVGLVLGSGLGDFAETIKTEATVEYKDIEGFPVSTVKVIKEDSYSVTPEISLW